MSKLIHTLDDNMRAKLAHLRVNGLKKGMWAGWHELYEHYTVKRGSTTYFVAPPAVGKTALIYELTMNLAQFENCKVCIFTPETGSPVDVYNELLWAYLKQPFLKHAGSTVTGKQVNEAMDWMAEHFYVLDPLHAELNESLYFRAINELQEELKQKIDIAVIDPITDMKIDGAARDLALGDFLTNVRKFSSSYDVHTMVAFHTKYIAPKEGTAVNGQPIRYYPPPTMADVAGGEMAARKGMFILGLWRPAAGQVNPETGEAYPGNLTRLEVLKAKPKAVGKRGVVNMYYDLYSSRYYTMPDGYDGDKQFSYPKPLDLDI